MNIGSINDFANYSLIPGPLRPYLLYHIYGAVWFSIPIKQSYLKMFNKQTGDIYAINLGAYLRQRKIEKCPPTLIGWCAL